MLEHNVNNLDDAYDFIRMLDGEGYPSAYIEVGGVRIELRGVKKQNGKLVGNFEIAEK